MFLLRLVRAPDELLGRDLVVEGFQVLLRLRRTKTKKGQQGGTSLEKKGRGGRRLRPPTYRTQGTLTEGGNPTPSCEDGKEERPGRPENRTATDNLFVHAVKADPPKWRDDRRRDFSGPWCRGRKVV